jgi:hypothetical protein
MRRMKMSRKKSKKDFSRKSGSKSINYQSARPMRGGYRL